MPDVEVTFLNLQNASGKSGAQFLQLLEVYVDDFIQLVQSSDPAVLLHCSRALLHGIHSVFPPPAITGHNGQDPISLKKLMEGKGLWEVRKEILGWMMDGATRYIKLSETRQRAIQKERKTILWIKKGRALQSGWGVSKAGNLTKCHRGLWSGGFQLCEK